MADVLVGADIGGTSTRVAVATGEEGIKAVALGGMGNPHLIGLEASAATIAVTIVQALSAARAAGVRGEVASVVIGLAGGSASLNDAGFARALLPDRVTAPVRIVSDLSVTFSSSTPAERGSAMIAGTGAIAGRILGMEITAHRDGWGWLLGDRGSGFWLGGAAVRLTMEQLDTGEPLGPLARAVLRGVGADPTEDVAGARNALIRSVYAEAPIRLARFAPLISLHAPDDGAAARIADQAGDLLIETLLSLDPDPGLPIVLGGSVLGTDGPISRRVRGQLGQRFHHLSIEPSGLVGATWLAARCLGQNDPGVHRLLHETARLIVDQSAP